MRRRALYSKIKSSNGEALPLTGAILGFSFRQLVPTATYAIRQYKEQDKVDFQDVGFVNGYIDIDSITTFANGTTTYFEWYNQFDNSLSYLQIGTRPMPRITNVGALTYKNNKVVGLFTGRSRLKATGISLGAQVATFQVGDGQSTPVIVCMNGVTGSKFIGIMQNGTTIAGYNAVGTPTFWKNQVEITPVNRDTLYDAIVTTHSQHTVKDLNLNSTSIYKGYPNDANDHAALDHSQEELWYDQSVMSEAEISAVEQNQMNYYL